MIFIDPIYPEIRILPEKKLIGLRTQMSFASNKTFELWNSFMPRRKEIINNLTSELFSMQEYDHSFDFINPNQNTKFEKWAAVEVSDYASIPVAMETHTLVEGLYAVFFYHGASNAASKTFQYIFTTWLPQSLYLLDKRTHFEILGEKYKNNDPDSEEEIWIPIKRKE